MRRPTSRRLAPSWQEPLPLQTVHSANTTCALFPELHALCVWLILHNLYCINMHKLHEIVVFAHGPCCKCATIAFSQQVRSLTSLLLVSQSSQTAPESCKIGRSTRKALPSTSQALPKHNTPAFIQDPCGIAIA